jgi:transcriptional regulator with XRE-family HTH domain
MPTIEQIRAARALLDWSQSDLADRADLSQTGIARIENGTNQPNTQTINKIKAAFESAGIQFIGMYGVNKRTNEVKTLRGVEGLKTLVDDIYATAKSAYDKNGNAVGVIDLYNAKPQNWHKWLGKEWWDMHAERMTALGPKVQRILTVEGETYFISSNFSEHKQFPAELFSDQSIYAYGNKLAFVTFDENVTVNILESGEFCDGFRVLFNIAWERVAKSFT